MTLQTTPWSSVGQYLHKVSFFLCPVATTEGLWGQAGNMLSGRDSLNMVPTWFLCIPVRLLSCWHSGQPAHCGQIHGTAEWERCHSVKGSLGFCLWNNNKETKKGKCRVLHLLRNNPMYQHRLRANLLGSSSAENRKRGPGGQQAAHEPGVCPGDQESQRSPGIH